jgi:multidrug transporter EmrE-like cation transporter
LEPKVHDLATIRTLLFAAGVLEILFAVCLKHTTALDRPWVLAGTAIALLGSLSMLTLSPFSSPATGH